MTLASKITLVRVAFIPVYMVLMYLSGGQPNWYLWSALGVFILASLTDFVDGQIARRCHQVSDFGKFLDPLADKLLTIAAMTMFCEWGSFPAWALMIVLTREFAVTGLRLVAVGKGNVIAAGWSGKVKTASTMIGLCVMMAFPTVGWLCWTVIAVIVVTTVWSGVEYFVQNWKCLWD
ncbi:MAG: CDP-diacylglycerol--glycerol-3-phosphate 3-phosphatidyltransferase [Oscillospiraceae bacterium]|jgi:CDP-diacylglycerol--glycerol-3-phosphate 3-phosphatidyltransferase|nr:CDP-diacylglycerol--glycerol-3-phosphate 3-phosphatidyltransferase [Oscillospiraceae bacterium]MBQ2383168.1 CDP-diacylglycerol--glycerol-3-phosphate 3-phosphatidyltransferase [Oscillospiraceae bacterium]